MDSKRDRLPLTGSPTGKDSTELESDTGRSILNMSMNESGLAA